MPVPKSVLKMDKNGVQFTSNVDRASYTLKELSRAAMRDTGKFVCRQTRQNVKAAGVNRRTGREAKNIQYWARKIEADLVVGYKKAAFYGGIQETGSDSRRKTNALKAAVYDNIDTIRDIEAQYLSHIEDEQRALSKINEDDYEGGGED